MPKTDAPATDVHLRLPQDLAEWLHAKAKNENRSQNGQAIHLLRICMNAEKEED